MKSHYYLVYQSHQFYGTAFQTPLRKENLKTLLDIYLKAGSMVWFLVWWTEGSKSTFLINLSTIPITRLSFYLHIRKLWFGMYFAAVKVNRGLALDQVFWEFAMFVKDSLYIEQDGEHLLSIEFLPRAWSFNYLLESFAINKICQKMCGLSNRHTYLYMLYWTLRWGR